MGYESKLYIGHVSEMFENNGRKYVIPIVTVDVSCAGNMVYDCFSERGGYYFGCGDKEIFEDCYGRQLGHCTLEKLYNWLTHLEGDDANYRRFKLLKKVLEGFLENAKQWYDEELIVLEYGF